MANPIIKIKRSSVPGKIPNASQVPLGEIALNTYDGKVFASRNVGIGTTVFVVNPWTVGTGTDTYNTYFTQGNVGIGTTNPSARLSVNGDVSIASTVGIGTIIDIIPYDTLDGGTLSYEASTGQLLSISNNLDSGTVFSVNDFSGSPSLEVLGDGTVSLAPYDTKVGIGSTIPSEKLDVLGNVNISGIITTSAISVGSTLTHTGTTASLNNTTTANTLNLATGATGSGVLKTINVGTNGAAGSRLLVNIGSATAGTASTVVVNSGTNVLIGAATSTGTASQPLQVTGGAYVSGNLGVGVTNPSDKLHVLSGNIRVDSTTGALTFWSGAGFFGGIGMAQAFGGSGTDLNLRSDTNRNIIFQTGGANERVRITSTGNVGIGTTNPGASLEILAPELNGSTPELRLSAPGGGANGVLELHHSLTGASYNNIVQTGDKAIIFRGTSSVGTGALVIAPHASATSGIRMIGSTGDVLIGSATPTGTASQPLQVTGGAYVSGNVGIGITNPSNRLHVLANEASGYAATFDNDGNNANRFGIRIQCGVDTGAGTAVAIDDGDGTNQGNITFNAGTVTYGAFTANHDCVIPSYEGEIPYGSLMVVNKILYKKRSDGTEMERGILYEAGISTVPYAKNLLGAYSYEYDESSPVQNGSDLSVHQVLVLGDGHIRCCGESGNIKTGDGITSSSIEGVGMKMNKIGIVIGIAQEDVEFENPTDVKLVPVQYGLHQYIPDNIAEYLEGLMG